MNVMLFAKMNRYAFGFNISHKVGNAKEGEMVVKLHKSINQILILIVQLVT